MARDVRSLLQRRCPLRISRSWYESSPTSLCLVLKVFVAQLNEVLGVPVISQRLFHRGKELEDSSATMLSLGILSNDLLDLKEESEDLALLSDTDVESGPANGSKKKRTEGQAFGGTLLGGYSFTSAPSSSPSIIPASNACPACTYENDAADTACAMCETPLPNVS